MPDQDRVIRYKCASVNCRHPGEQHINVLARDGCPICGSKRIEIWDTDGSHELIDWRSQKSVRKRRRRLAVPVLALLVLGVFLGPLHADTWHVLFNLEHRQAYRVFVVRAGGDLEFFDQIGILRGTALHFTTGPDVETVRVYHWADTIVVGVGDDIPDVQTFALLPNPSAGRVTIRSDQDGAIEFFDVSGRRRWGAVLWAGSQELEIPLPAGVYFYRVTRSGELIQNGKVVIVK